MKLILILLAAGDSKRFHGNKLLHLIHGKMMYEYVVDEVETVKDLFEQRIVVTQYPEIMLDLESRGYQVIENHESALGISHSIELAVKQVQETWKNREPETALCFAVCDQPYLTGHTMRALVEGWKESEKGMGCPCFQGEMGNPVIFNGSYMKELLLLEGDVGGKRVLKKHMEDVYLYEVTDGKELVDVDERNGKKCD